MSSNNNVYEDPSGRKFHFNDQVVIEMVPVPDDERVGRLVQVRKGCGQFGSDTILVRTSTGKLCSFENVLVRHVDDEAFLEAFYKKNDTTPPKIPEQQPDAFGDSETAEYSIVGKWPETGFVVDNPKQPETPGSFSMAFSPAK